MNAHNSESRERAEDDGRIYWAILTVTLMLTAVISAGLIAWKEGTRFKTQKQLEQLAERTTAGAEDDIVGDAVSDRILEYALLYDITVPDKHIDFEWMHKNVSEDIYAWICIPGTNIDYPVLQHPTDNSYYLDYNLDGTKGYPGCIYTENYNSKDFTDRHTVIYGHNMRDGTMFSDLHKYEDADFFGQSPYIFIYTENDVLVYTIFAAYETNNTHLLLGFDLSSDDVYLSYLEGVLSREGQNSNVPYKNIQFNSEDRILTLSTCITEILQPAYRYVVQGVLIDVERG
ncbi:MAG: class B sortase [Butyrivibrio sp.]|nr:class B sortase [Butyrivibrio sp.]